MKTKKEIVKDWITRYTGVEISIFGEYILLTNFQKYVDELEAFILDGSFGNVDIFNVKSICKLVQQSIRVILCFGDFHFQTDFREINFGIGYSMVLLECFYSQIIGICTF